MTNSVKSFAEVHHQLISLMSILTVSGQVMIELLKLGFAGELASVAMLWGIQHIMLLCVIHNMPDNHMFKQLAANTGQANWLVIHRKCVFPSLYAGTTLALRQS